MDGAATVRSRSPGAPPAAWMAGTRRMALPLLNAAHMKTLVLIQMLLVLLACVADEVNVRSADTVSDALLAAPNE